MPEIPVEAISQFGAFTRAQAMRSGWTRGSTSHALHRGQIKSIRLGIYVAADVMHGIGFDAQRSRVAAMSAAPLLSQSGSVASHRSAAVLAGLPVVKLPTQPCVTVIPSGRRSTADVHVHRRRQRAGRGSTEAERRSSCAEWALSQRWNRSVAFGSLRWDL
jgi:hypothetical protein